MPKTWQIYSCYRHFESWLSHAETTEVYGARARLRGRLCFSRDPRQNARRWHPHVGSLLVTRQVLDDRQKHRAGRRDVCLRTPRTAIRIHVLGERDEIALS